MKILFLGTSGPLSVVPLRYLVQSGHELCAIGYPASTEVFSEYTKYPIIASENENVEMLARVANIPTIKLFSNDDVYVESIESCQPDIIIVSCMAMKLPETVLSIPRLGCFNLHPSLLPLFRGPVPLFWQFREGIKTFGITLHRMNANFDAGPVVAQHGLSMPDGVSNQQASTLLANAAAELLDQCLEKIAGRGIIEIEQNEAVSSTMSYPKDSDFEVNTLWSARRMYNFLCATRHWGNSYPCRINGEDYRLLEAVSYERAGNAEQIFSSNGDTISVPCIDGAVTARLAAGQPLGV